MPTEYFFPMFPRLEPCTPWTGGRITDTDTVTLLEAASMATIHAGQTVTAGDFLRAAGRGEIALRAIVHRTAKVQKHDGGVYCNGGTANENTVPAGAIPTLPLTACKALAATGRASWRTFDDFEIVDGELCRFTKGLLIDGEPDFETVPDDCRVTGNHVHALADAFKPQDNTQTAPTTQADTPPATVVEAPASETPEQRRARLLEWFDSYKGGRGAKQRVFEREKLLNPKADRSDIGKQIEKAKAEQADKKRGGGWTSQLVQDGKR